MFGLFRKLFGSKTPDISWDKPIRLIDLLSEHEVLQIQSDRMNELLVLLKHGHEADLPGCSEVDKNDQAALTRWAIDFIFAPLTKDMRPQLRALVNEYKQQETANGPSG